MTPAMAASLAARALPDGQMRILRLLSTTGGGYTPKRVDEYFAEEIGWSFKKLVRLAGRGFVQNVGGVYLITVAGRAAVPS